MGWSRKSHQEEKCIQGILVWEARGEIGARKIFEIQADELWGVFENPCPANKPVLMEVLGGTQAHVGVPEGMGPSEHSDRVLRLSA